MLRSATINVKVRKYQITNKKGGVYYLQNTGAKIKTLRKESKMSQIELAEKIGVSRSTLANWEIDRRQPNFHYLKLIANVFNVPLDYFGISKTNDYVFDLVCRAKNIFLDESISEEVKEEIYQEMMKLYLTIKGK